jgi:hypothetical protein
MLKYIPFIAILTFIFFSTGCERSGKDVISKKRIVPLLVDLHKVEGMAMLQSFNKTFSTFDNVELYESVFQKHGVTREQFEKSVHYYSNSPLEFEQIYEKVIAEITGEQTHLAELIAEAARDTTANLWTKRPAFSLPDDGDASELEVDIPVKGTGLYTFSAQIRLYKDDQAADPAINLWFWYDDGSETGIRDSFPTTSINKDGKLHFYSVSKELTDTMFTHIKGHLLDYGKPDTLIKKHASIFQIRISLKETVPDWVESDITQ